MAEVDCRVCEQVFADTTMWEHGEAAHPGAKLVGRVFPDGSGVVGRVFEPSGGEEDGQHALLGVAAPQDGLLVVQGHQAGETGDPA